jgi:predicted nuclease of predicted toxin-antitoxin system
MTILADHNLEGHAALLWDAIALQGWLAMLSLRLVMLSDVGLPDSVSDRELWRFAQSEHLIILTGNRRMKGKDALERVIREENTPVSLPVITIARVDRLINREYRERCAVRLVEIVFDLHTFLGAGRIFIP